MSRARIFWGHFLVTFAVHNSAMNRARLRQLARLRERKAMAERPICGARCRDGHPCKRMTITDKTRCHCHGGLSTGPRSAAGRAAIAESNRRRTGEKRKPKQRPPMTYERWHEIRQFLARQPEFTDEVIDSAMQRTIGPCPPPSM